MNSIVRLIQSRRSIGNLNKPMPNKEELSIILETALTAPDHKKLVPYQISILTEDNLDKFGDVLLKAGKEKAIKENKTLDEIAEKKLSNMPKRAPMIITVATNFKQHDKVPEFEQLLSVGAVIQNILLILESMGYKSIWRTGDLANEKLVKEFFKVSDDNIICGFIYIGSSDIVLPNREKINQEYINQIISIIK